MIKMVSLFILPSGVSCQVLKMLSVAMGLHMLAAVLMLSHLWRYSTNGEGIPFLEALSESEIPT